MPKVPLQPLKGDWTKTKPAFIIHHFFINRVPMSPQYVVNSGVPSARGNENLVSTKTFCILSSLASNL